MVCLENEEMSEDAAENDRSKSGHADRAGVGEDEGEGEESRVAIGEAGMVSSGARNGLNAILTSKTDWPAYCAQF